MKSKAPLALMEQLVMILVFALAAALCLQMFVFSDSISANGETLDCAVTAVQNAAEAVKLHSGNLQRLADAHGGELSGAIWQTGYDAQWHAASVGGAKYVVDVCPIEDGDPLLGSAEVAARKADGETLFQVAVCWQEENDG